jgi:hypothetical protein
VSRKSGFSIVVMLISLTVFPCTLVQGQSNSAVASVKHPNSNFGFSKGMNRSRIAELCKCKLEHADAAYFLKDKRFGPESDFVFNTHSAPKEDSDFYFFTLGIDPARGLLYLNALSSSLLFSPSDGDLEHLDQSILSTLSRLTASYGKPDYTDIGAQGEPLWKRDRSHLTDCGRDAAGPCNWITVAEWKSDVLLADHAPRGANVKIEFGEGVAPAVMSFFGYRLVVTYDGWDKFLDSEAHRQAGLHSITN